MNVIKSSNEHMTRYFNLSNLIMATEAQGTPEPEITLWFTGGGDAVVRGEEATRIKADLDLLEHQTTLRWLGKAMQTKPDGAK